MELYHLRQMQSLPLEAKILKSQQRIREWYEHWDGQVYVSFSGGKDSTVLLHLVRSLYPDVPAVFVDTGLEYPEIKKFVETIDNVMTRRPKKSFNQVLHEEGYPIISKKVSRMLHDIKNPKDTNENTRTLYLTGVKRDGTKSKCFKMPNKWKFLINSPFKISNKCCDIMKKEPFHEYEKETKRKPFTGIMADDSSQRESTYLKTGCNSFKGKKSNPLGFWTEQDVLYYLTKYDIPYCPVYGDIIRIGGVLQTTGESRTGCMFCGFGCHLEKGENRFQRMKKTHPKIYDYCINKLGMGEVLDYIGVKYA